MDNDEIIRVENLDLVFGKAKVLNSISLSINKSETLSIVGPNGAGKTCLLNCINGFYKPQEGAIYFGGKDLTKLPSYKISQMGISRTFQRCELYAGLSTIDNLMAARHNLINYGIFSAAAYFCFCRKEEVRHREVCEQVLDFLEMEPIRKAMAGSLPFGLRKRIELGRALAAEPKIILLDEPMAGMNLEEKEDMVRFIIDIFEEKGITCVLIEHDMEVVMDISHRIVVLDFGNKIAEGTPDEIKTNQRVIEAYLGKGMTTDK